MKRAIFYLTFTFFTFHFSLFTAKAEGENWQALYDSTNTYMQKQEYQTALEWGQKALVQGEEEFGKLDTNYVNNLNLLSRIWYYNGNLDKAILYGKRTMESCRNLYKTDHPYLANSITVLGFLNCENGDYKKAESLYIEAFEMNKRIHKTDNPEFANTINFLARFYKTIGSFEKAEPLYLKSLDMRKRLYQTDNPSIAESLGDLALFYKLSGDFIKAKPLYEESLAMYRRIYKTDHPFKAIIINNMARFYHAIGENIQAESLFIESLEMAKRIHKIENKYLSTSISNIGYFYYSINDYVRAEMYSKEAVEINKRIYKSNNPHLTSSIYILAEMKNAMFNFAEAEPLYLKVLNYYYHLILHYFPSLSEQEKKNLWNTTKDKFESFNSFAAIRSIDNPKILRDMYDNHLFTKGLLFNSTSKVKSRILNSNDSVLIDKYHSWSDKKEFLVKLYSITSEEVKKKGFDIDSIENVANELEKELTLKSEDFKKGYEKKKYNWRMIQTMLPPDEAAVEVIRFRKRGKVPNQYNPEVMIDGFTDTVCYAFLIVSEKTEENPELVLLENGEELENEYYNMYRNMIEMKIVDNESFSSYWSKLHEKLKGYKKIYFSADGIYNKLNPATLQMPDGKFIFDMYDIQQLNSTKDILLGFYETKQESNIYNSAVLIGNPNFSLGEEEVKVASSRIRSEAEENEIWEPMASTRGIKLTKLPGTEKEIKDVEQFLQSRKWDVKTYLGDMALKAAVKEANNPRVLHIATHGMFLEDVKRDRAEIFGFDQQKMVENPLLRSGLFFTGAENYLQAEDKPTGDDNGVLTAYEAMNLNLDKTELVVLSACETGLGEVQNGEGVFGLRRAFQTAGAKTVVMSLWTVSDQATQELMSNFYSNWVTGMTKREAFNKAQQSIKDKYKDPYYWGAFVMVGE